MKALIKQYEIRLVQLEAGHKELYTGEKSTIKAILKKAGK